MANEPNEKENKSSNSLTFETVKIAHEKAESSLTWLANILLEKTWSGKLILISVLIYFIFNPYYLSVIKLIAEGATKSQYYQPVFIFVEASLLLAAFYLILKKIRDEKETNYEITRLKSKTIRGLLSFTKEDADVFSKLQRGTKINHCSQAISREDFRFGILSGKSGSGKSSILQAGIGPELEKENHRIIYVKLSNESVFQTIGEAVKTACHLSSDAAPGDMKLPALFDLAAGDGIATIFILDQFEQFFVFYKNKEDRREFISQISDWYLHQQKKPVKILFSIRSDFRNEIDADFQGDMNYALTQYQNFTLEKFTPAEAAEVFRAMAAELEIDFDKAFIEKICREQLAGKDDGLISPVDVQVLAQMMILVNQDKKEVAFDENAFQKVGGVEGLMEEFLKLNLNSLSPDKTNPLRQAAVNTLKALTDLDRNTRAGILSEEQIREKLAATNEAAKVDRAIKWLEELRLITLTERDRQNGYELSHERIIPALRRIIEEEDGPAQQANRMLDRRTNEWIGNNRSNRYLFSWFELQNVKKYQNLFDWGENRENKKDLISESWKRLKLRLLQAGLPLVLIFTGVGSFFYWWRYTDSAKIYWAEREIRKGVTESIETDVLMDAAEYEVIKGHPDLAEQYVRKLAPAKTNFNDTLYIAKLLRERKFHTEAINLLYLAENIITNDESNSNLEELINLNQEYVLNGLEDKTNLNQEFDKNEETKESTSIFQKIVLKPGNEEQFVQNFLKDTDADIFERGDRIESLILFACELKRTGKTTTGNKVLIYSLLNEIPKNSKDIRSANFHPSDKISKRFAQSFSSSEIIAISDEIEDDYAKYRLLVFSSIAKENQSNFQEANELAEKLAELSGDDKNNTLIIENHLLFAKIKCEIESEKDCIYYSDQAIKKLDAIKKIEKSNFGFVKNRFSEEFINNLLEAGNKTQNVRLIDYALKIVEENRVILSNKRSFILAYARTLAEIAINKESLESQKLLDQSQSVLKNYELKKSSSQKEVNKVSEKEEAIKIAAIFAGLKRESFAKDILDTMVPTFGLLESGEEVSSIMPYNSPVGKVVLQTSITYKTEFILNELVIRTQMATAFDKSQMIYYVAPIYARMGNLAKATELADQVGVDVLKTRVYAKILEKWEIYNNPKLSNIEADLREIEVEASYF